VVTWGVLSLSDIRVTCDECNMSQFIRTQGFDSADFKVRECTVFGMGAEESKVCVDELGARERRGCVSEF